MFQILLVIKFDTFIQFFLQSKTWHFLVYVSKINNIDITSIKLIEDLGCLKYANNGSVGSLHEQIQNPWPHLIHYVAFKLEKKVI